MKANPNFEYLHERVNNQRVTLLQGGTRSGKTYATIYFLIDYCLLYTGMEIDIVRDTFTALKATAWKDFQDVLMSCNLYDDRNHNKTDHSYTLNGNNINYYGADTPDKIHGRSRDILWINEAHQFPQSTIDQLFPRTRYRIICDYNPALGLEHWLDKYIAKYPPLITTYKDNPYLTVEQVEDIESRTGNKYWWSIYGSGERAAREGAIFTNWNIGDFDTSLPYCYGQDYGFSIDPTTLIKVAIDSSKKIVYCHELLYSTNSMGTEAIYSTNKELIQKPNDLIVADNAEGRLISDLKGKGLNIIACTKGQGSVQAGITALQDYTLVVTNTSVNLKSELSNYIWNDKKAGIPVDAFNHCFIGETLITTINGRIRIDEIVVDDLVLTSQGYKPVLKVFNNGVKQVNKYLMQFDTFSLYLTATESHKIKTENGWTQISKLKSGQTVCLHKTSTANNTHYTTVKDIFQGEQKECTLQFGSSIMGKLKKVFTFTTKTVTHGITIFLTWSCLSAINIFLNIAEKGIKIIPNGQRRFIQRVLNRLRNGINQKMESSGIRSNKKEIGKLKNGIVAFVSNVAKNTKHLSLIEVNTAITTAKLKHLEVEESRSEVVYDLMVDECHEYFANGVLVHNCIDPIRYAFNKLNNVIIVAPPRALGNRYRNED